MKEIRTFSDAVGELRTLAEAGALARLAELLKKGDPSLPSLTSVVPFPILTFLVALRSQSLEQLVATAPASAHKDIKTAKEIVETHLPNAQFPPEILGQISENVKLAQIENEIPFKGLSSVSALPMWIESEGRLVPFARLRLRDAKNEAMLDEVLDWDDLSFLVLGTAQALQQELERAETKHRDLIELPFSQQVKERVSKLEKTVQQMSQLVAKLTTEPQKKP